MKTFDAPEPLLQIESTSVTFDEWLSRPYISDTLREKLGAANVLIIPYENYPRVPGHIFPNGTDQVYEYFRKNAPPEVRADILSEADDYRELALHSELIIIGSFLVSVIVGPTVANLISAYIVKRTEGKKNAHVEIELTQVNADGSGKHITYRGAAGDFAANVGPYLTPIASTSTTDTDGNEEITRTSLDKPAPLSPSPQEPMIIVAKNEQSQ